MVPHMGDKGLRRLIVKMGDQFDNLLDLREADIRGQNPDKLDRIDGNELLRARAADLLQGGHVHAKLPSGTGDVLMAELGLKPDAELGRIMKTLTQKLIDGVLTVDADFAQEARKL